MTEDPLANARIFFLGAGFSAGAGVPLTNALLPQAARLFRLEAPGLYERVKGYADDVDVNLDGAPNAEEFARFCTYLDFVELREHGGGERWSREGCRERVALKFFLAKAIAMATPAASDLPACYLSFAAGLRATDVVLTFNWDVLLEKALVRVGMPYSYSSTDPMEKLWVVKLHGSVNWIEGRPSATRPDARSYAYQPIGFAGGMIDTEVFASGVLNDASAWTQPVCLVDEVKPLLVLPGYGKAVDVRLLAPLWYQPEFLSYRRGGISIVGLSVAQDDYIVESLFRYLFRGYLNTSRVRVLNPDAAVGEKFRSLAGGPLDFSAERFNEDTVSYALHD